MTRSPESTPKPEAKTSVKERPSTHDAAFSPSEFTEKRDALKARYDALEKEYQETRDNLDAENIRLKMLGFEAVIAAQAELDNLDPAVYNLAYFDVEEEKKAALRAAQETFLKNQAEHGLSDSDGDVTTEAVSGTTEEVTLEATPNTDAGDKETDTISQPEDETQKPVDEPKNHEKPAEEEKKPSYTIITPEGSGTEQPPVKDAPKKEETNPEAEDDDEDTDTGRILTFDRSDAEIAEDLFASYDDTEILSPVPLTLDQYESRFQQALSQPVWANNEEWPQPPVHTTSQEKGLDIPQELHEQLTEELERTRNVYAALTARDRKSYIGRFMKNSRILNWMQRLSDRIDDRLEAKEALLSGALDDDTPTEPIIPQIESEDDQDTTESVSARQKSSVKTWMNRASMSLSRGVSRGLRGTVASANSVADSLNAYSEAMPGRVNNLLNQDSKLANSLRKVSAINKIAEIDTNKTLTEARADYEDALNTLQSELTRLMREQGFDYDTTNATIIGMALDSDLEFEEKVAQERMKQSKSTNKFVNMWVKQQGFKGKVIKGGALVVTGAVIGTAGAAAGVGLLSVGAAAAIGTGLGVHVGRRRANAVDAHGVTLAKRQAEEDQAKKRKIADKVEAYSRESSVDKERFNTLDPDSNNIIMGIDPTDFTDVTEQRTDQEMRGNRNRVKAAAAAMTLGAKAAGMTYSAIHHSVDSMPSHTTPDRGAQIVPADTPKLPVTGGDVLKGQDFMVNPGDGYTNTLQHFASANGHTLNSSQAYDLHKAIMQKFGSDYIDIQGSGGHDVYTSMGGDVQLSTTGSAKYINGVADFADTWIKSHGL